MTATRTDITFLRRRRRSDPERRAAASAEPALTLSAPSGIATRTTGRRVPPAPLLRGLPVLHGGHAQVLDTSAPAVMLGRVPSGIGALTCTVATGTPTSLAVAYEARGVQGVLTQPGHGFGPDATHPRLSLTTNGVRVDLGHVDEIRRFLVLLGDADTADGTLLVATDTDIRLSITLEPSPRPGRLAALTGHVARGALVLRAERRHLSGTLRDAVNAYDYRSVAWASPDHPLPPHT